MNALEPHHLRTVERWTLALGAALLAVGFLFARPRTLFAMAVGAGLMAANAWAIRKLTERAFREGGGRIRPAAAVLLFNLKMLALVGLVFVALKLLGLDAIGFLLGISVFPAAIVLAALKLNLGADETTDAPDPTPHGDR